MPALSAPSAPATGSEPASRRRWWRRHPLLAFLAVSTVLGGYDSVAEAVDEWQDLEPVRATQRAAETAGMPIGVVDRALAQRWSEGPGPSEAEVSAATLPGNAYLEPLYFSLAGEARAHGSTAVGDRCYFIAVQPGESFDADQVQSIGRVCFDGSASAPTGTSLISTRLP